MFDKHSTIARNNVYNSTLLHHYGLTEKDIDEFTAKWIEDIRRRDRMASEEQASQASQGPQASQAPQAPQASQAPQVSDVEIEPLADWVSRRQQEDLAFEREISRARGTIREKEKIREERMRTRHREEVDYFSAYVESTARAESVGPAVQTGNNQTSDLDFSNVSRLVSSLLCQG